MKAPKLENSRTFKNVRKAFADEAELVFRYLYCATLAEFEGMEKHAALFKELAEGGTCSVHGCLDFLKLAQDPDSEISFGGTLRQLSAVSHKLAWPSISRSTAWPAWGKRSDVAFFTPSALCHTTRVGAT